MKKIAALLSLLLLFPLLHSLHAQNSWEKKTSFSASKRARSVAFAIGNRGYLCCGEDTNDVELNDLWEYDPGSDSWTQKANLPAAGRRDAVGFAIGNKGYVGTGMDAPESWTGNILNDWWEYSPATNTWTAKAAYPGGFGGIYFATGFVVNGKGYVCCGKEGASYYSQELWEFNPTTNNWTQKAYFPGGVRYGQSSFTLNGKAYVGLGTDENWYCGDFWEYNPLNDTWSPKATFPGSARSFASAFALGGLGYMGLGTDGGYRDDFYEYDPISNTWNVKANYGGPGRRSAPSFVIAGAGYVMTGKGATGKHRDNWQYHPYLAGVNELNDADAKVFPNPATDYVEFDLTYELAHVDGVTINLYSAEGKLVKSEKAEGRTKLIFTNENWAAGTYTYSITDGIKNYTSGTLVVQ